jgi:hypothetical protein
MYDLCLQCGQSIYGEKAPSPAYAMRTARLLLGTAAQEGWTWERQRSPAWSGNVGGFSKWQVERGSISDSLMYLHTHPAVLSRATTWLFDDPHAPTSWPSDMSMDTLLWSMRLNDNDRIGVLFCRLHYLRVPKPIPDSLADQAHYYKVFYNTVAGAGTEAGYIENWNRLCAAWVEDVKMGSMGGMG